MGRGGCLEAKKAGVRGSSLATSKCLWGEPAIVKIGLLSAHIEKYFRSYSVSLISSEVDWIFFEAEVE